MQSNLEQHLTKIKDQYKDIISFIEKPDFNEEEYDIFMKKISYQNKNELGEYLHLFSSISGGHHPTQYFYSKFERILRDLQNDIKQFFSSYEIYNIFEKNIRILYFLIKEKIVIIDQYILNKWISNQNFMIYFADLAIEAFPSYEDVFETYIKNFDFYYKYRFNDDRKDSINSIIQKDSLNDFISYIQENKTNLSSKIDFITDFYDMKLYMLNQSPKLIDCAAYFGSFQIFQYLINNGVEVDIKTMHHSIYGQNLEIIHILEKANIKPDKESYEISIKCHHNEIKDYIKTNYFNDYDNIDNDYLTTILNYHNYSCIKTDFITESNFYNFCKFDYIYFVEFLLQSENLNLNSKFEKKTEKDDIEKVTSKTPLYISIKKGNIEITKLLMKQKNIDVNTICSKIERLNGQIIKNEIFTSVNAAILAQNDEIIELILTNPNIDVNLRLSKYKYITGINDDASLTDIKNVKEQTNEYSYIIEAVREKYYKAVQILLSNPKIDVNVTFHYLFKNDENECQISDLHLLSIPDDIEMAKLLLKHPQININSSSISTSYCNFNNKNKKFIKSYNESTFLIIAITSKNTELVRFIMSNKDVDCNIKSINRKRINDTFEEELYTPLYIAVKNESVDIVDILLSNPKTDANAISLLTCNNDTSDNKTECTALHCAIKMGNIEILKLLLSNHSIDANILHNNLISCVPNNGESPSQEKDSEFEENSSSSSEEENSSSSSEEENSSSSSEEENSEKQNNEEKKDSQLEIERKTEVENEPEEDSASEKDSEFEESSSSEEENNDALSSSSEEEDNKKNKQKKIFSETKKLSALQMCLDSNNIDLFNLLISHNGIDLNIRSIYKNKTSTNIKIENTILCSAVEKGNIDFIKQLLTKQEIDVNKKSIETSHSPKETDSALSYIYHLGDKIKTIKEKTPLSIVMLKENKEIIQLLLSNPNIDVNSKLIESTESQSKDTKKEYTPLFIAINNNCDETFIEELLTNPKIDINILLTESTYTEDVDENKKFLSNLKKLISIANNENNNNKEEDDNDEKRNKELCEKKQFNVLHFAVKNNKISLIKLLLNHSNIDLNIKSIHYQNESNCLLTKQTALHIAIENEKPEIVQLLLSKKETDVNSIFYSDLKRCTDSLETKKYTPLHLAVEKSNVDIVELLIDRKDLDVNYLAFLSKGRAEKNSDEKNFLDKKSQTALYMAIDKYNSKIVELLLKRDDIDVNIQTKEEGFAKPYNNYGGYERETFNSPLALAVTNQKVEIVELLLRKPKIDTKTKSIVRFKDYGAEKMKNYENSLFQKAVQNSVSKIQILKLLLPYIELNVNDGIDFQGEKTPLYFAIQGWKMELFDIILQQKDIDVNKISYFESGEFVTPLFMSLFIQNWYAFNNLLKRPDIDINKFSKHRNNNNVEELTDLQIAIQKCPLNYLELILNYQNIDVNLPLTRTTIINEDNKLIEKLTPLYVAIEVGDCDKIKLLLSKNDVDIDAVNTIELKGDVNDHNELTALHKAMLINNAEIIKLIKDYKLKNKK